jgi:exopolysaccharide biosynthesis polyprenyl glycosylphosphotransferase
MVDWPHADAITFEGATDLGERKVARHSREKGLHLRRDRVTARDVFLLTDCLAFLTAYLLIALPYASTVAHHRLGAAVAFWAAAPLWLIGAKVSGLYDRTDRHPGHSTLDDLGRIFQLSIVAVWGSAITLWVATGSASVPAELSFWAIMAACLVAGRAIAGTAARRRAGFVQNTVIIGAGEVGQLVGRKIAQHPEFGLRLVGFVDADPREIRGDLQDTPVLGSPVDIEDVVRRHQVDRAIVAFSNDRHDLLVGLVRELRELNVQIDLVPRLFEAVGPVAGVHLVEGMPLVGLPPLQHSRFARGAKRAVDFVGAAAALVLVSPLFAFVALRIKRDSPGPVFFRQERLGEGQRPFTVIKFRTMVADADEAPHREYVRKIMDSGAVPNENNLYKLERRSDITPFGQWLRRTSVDELPQLINVLRGEMSLVGPRPCISYETELFEPHHFSRFLVPAGMTGLWQVTSRAHSTMKEALDLDVAYARNWSFGLDLWVLARTPLSLLRGGDTT